MQFGVLIDETYVTELDILVQDSSRQHFIQDLSQLLLTVSGLSEGPPCNESIGSNQNTSIFSNSTLCVPIAMDVHIIQSMTDTITGNGDACDFTD